jgi:hypothetical protein
MYSVRVMVVSTWVAVPGPCAALPAEHVTVLAAASSWLVPMRNNRMNRVSADSALVMQWHSPWGASCLQVEGLG